VGAAVVGGAVFIVGWEESVGALVGFFEGAKVGFLESVGAVVGVDVVGPGIGDAVVAVRV